jgi:hypothetical protein
MKPYYALSEITDGKEPVSEIFHSLVHTLKEPLYVFVPVQASKLEPATFAFLEIPTGLIQAMEMESRRGIAVFPMEIRHSTRTKVVGANTIFWTKEEVISQMPESYSADQQTKKLVDHNGKPYELEDQFFFENSILTNVKVAIQGIYAMSGSQFVKMRLLDREPSLTSHDPVKIKLLLEKCNEIGIDNIIKFCDVLNPKHPCHSRPLNFSIKAWSEMHVDNPRSNKSGHAKRVNNWLELTIVDCDYRFSANLIDTIAVISNADSERPTNSIIYQVAESLAGS